MNETIYREIILEHGMNPDNFFEPEKFTSSSDAENELCGDHITSFIGVKKGVVHSINFTGEGCMVMRASASILSRDLKKKDVMEIMKLKPEDALGMLGIELTPTRTRCALLPLEALHSSLENVLGPAHG